MIRIDDLMFHSDDDGGRLKSFRTLASITVKFVEEDSIGGLDSFDPWGDDLHVLIHKPVIHSGVLEFLNRLVAERFDLPTRIVSVKFGQFHEGMMEGEFKPADPALSVLLTADLIHLITPRSTWLEYREQNEARRRRLQSLFDEARAS